MPKWSSYYISEQIKDPKAKKQGVVGGLAIARRKRGGQPKLPHQDIPVLRIDATAATVGFQTVAAATAARE